MSLLSLIKQLFDSIAGTSESKKRVASLFEDKEKSQFTRTALGGTLTPNRSVVRKVLNPTIKKYLHVPDNSESETVKNAFVLADEFRKLTCSDYLDTITQIKICAAEELDVHKRHQLTNEYDKRAKFNLYEQFNKMSDRNLTNQSMFVGFFVERVERFLHDGNHAGISLEEVVDDRIEIYKAFYKHCNRPECLYYTAAALFAKQVGDEYSILFDDDDDTEASRSNEEKDQLLRQRFFLNFDYGNDGELASLQDVFVDNYRSLMSCLDSDHVHLVRSSMFSRDKSDDDRKLEGLAKSVRTSFVNCSDLIVDSLDRISSISKERFGTEGLDNNPYAQALKYYALSIHDLLSKSTYSHQDFISVVDSLKEYRKRVKSQEL